MSNMVLLVSTVYPHSTSTVEQVDGFVENASSKSARPSMNYTHALVASLVTRKLLKPEK